MRRVSARLCSKDLHPSLLSIWVTLLYEPLRIKIDLMTYEIKFKLFIILVKDVYEEYFAVYRALIS